MGHFIHGLFWTIYNVLFWPNKRVTKSMGYLNPSIKWLVWLSNWAGKFTCKGEIKSSPHRASSTKRGPPWFQRDACLAYFSFVISWISFFWCVKSWNEILAWGGNWHISMAGFVILISELRDFVNQGDHNKEQFLLFERECVNSNTSCPPLKWLEMHPFLPIHVQ